MVDRTPDDDIARALCSSDARAAHAAEAELARRYGRRVFLYGMRHLRDEARAEDLAQDVILAVIQKLRAGDVQKPERLGSFVLGTARWMAHGERRRARRESEVAGRAELERQQAVMPRETLDAERVAGALSVLTERERSVIVLTYSEDRDAREIAEALGIDPGHVRVLRHRAIARLASSLGLERGESS